MGRGNGRVKRGVSERQSRQAFGASFCPLLDRSASRT
jgi:hypothetical protein